MLAPARVGCDPLLELRPEPREVELADWGHLMAAIATGRPATMILNVRNGSLVPQLPEDAVVEVGCVVDADGVHPWPIAPVEGEMLGLMASVKAAERHVITAATTGSREHAWRAFAAHPLVDSVAVARSLLDTYSERFEAIGRLLS